MFCVLKHPLGRRLDDSGSKEKFPKSYATSARSGEAVHSYWNPEFELLRAKNEKLLFESLNEETNFSNEGSWEKATQPCPREQLFIRHRTEDRATIQSVVIIAGTAHTSR